MRSMLVFGILLLALGVGILAYQGISYTQREHVAQLGPVHVTKEERKTIRLPPVLGVTAVGVGAVLIVAGVRRSNNKGVARPDDNTTIGREHRRK